MKIEEGEAIFGKRWADWSEAERREFVSCLEANEINFPLVINWALHYADSLQPKALQWLENILERSRGNANQ